ncbi:hypothetical protein B0A53_04659 [Rhodotorula sp. CCFEE 5036]|nr:hypothetical protein B0A53_04659 [Rhodotorula sp. CCFEE 5036]
MASPPAWLFALVFRLLNALCSRAFFQPDEYWQNLEVAHRWIYGYGYQTWEWRTLATSSSAATARTSTAAGPEWGKATSTWADVLRTGGQGGIRSPLSVAGTALVYAVLKVTSLDNGALLASPASADMAARRLAARVLGPSYANAALFASLTSFFNFHTSTRTFSNSTETALTAWALALWPWDTYSRRPVPPQRQKEDLKRLLPLALALAALATVIRPSNAVIWLVLGGLLFLRAPRIARFDIVCSAGLIACSAILISLVLDTTFYGTPTLTPLRFLHTNVFQSISLFYGANAWHFYLSQGVPILLATQVPFFLDGVFSFSGSHRLAVAVQNERALSALWVTLVATLGTYSLLSHKEWRFIHPLLPIMHLFVAYSLVRRRGTISSPRTPRHHISVHSRLAQVLRIRPLHALVVAFSLLPAFYLTAFHGLAQNTVMSHLRTELERETATTLVAGRSRTSTLGFLMPCHSTGWQAFLHRPEMEESEGGAASASDEGSTRLWMLTCEPPILGQDPATYRDDSDMFYSDPCGYVTSRSLLLPPASSSSSPEPSTSTSRLVLFSNLLEQPCLDPIKTGAATVGELLLSQGRYAKEWEGWNTLGGWHEDERRTGTVVVLRRGGDDDQR